MIRRLLQPNLIRRAVAIAIGGGRYAATGFSRASGVLIWSRYYNVEPTLGANATFTRAGSAYVQDHLGVYNQALANESRMEGARRAENWIAGTSENLVNPTNWASYGGGIVIDATTINCIDTGLLTIRNLTWHDIATDNPYLTGLKFTVSFDAARISGTGNVGVNIGASGGFGGAVFVTLTSTIRRYSITMVCGSAIRGADFYFTALGTYHLSKVMAELIPAGASEAPSEYVSVGVLSAPYHGANVDGVKYFPYANGNTVDGSGVVTEAQGAPINPATMYLLMEPAATNLQTKISTIARYSCTLGAMTSSPTGAIDAPLLYGDVGASSWWIAKTIAGVNLADTISVSCFVKKSSYRYAFLWLDDGYGYTDTVEFDLQNGTARQTCDSAKFSNITFSMTAYGYGFWRLCVNGIAAVNLSLVWRLYFASTAWVSGNYGTSVQAGDGVSGNWIYGFQVTKNQGLSSYIPTTTVAVTRAADALAYSGVPADNITTYTDSTGTESNVGDWTGAVANGKIRSIEVFNDPSGDFGFNVINTQTIAGQFSTLSGQSVTVYWGDGTSTTYTGTDQSYSKDYGSVGNRRVHIVGSEKSLKKFTMSQAGANVSFPLADLPSGLTYFYCAGSNTVSGAISDLPSGLTYFYCQGSDTINDYTTKTWANNQDRVYHIPINPGGLSTSEIDQLLIDLALVATWVTNKSVYLTGTNAARSAASDAAVATLQGKGVTVTTN